MPTADRAHGAAVPEDPAAPQDIVEIERAISRVSHLLTRYKRHDRTVAAAGVPVDRAAVPLLRLLADHAEPMRPGELAARLAVEAPHVTRQLQRLERAGYVERVADPDDGRAHRVRLRGPGREAVECVRAVGRRWMDEALADWSPEDRGRLAVLVHRMLDDFVAHSEMLRDPPGTGPATAPGTGPERPA